MQVIGFFNGFFASFSVLLEFVNAPLKSLWDGFGATPLGDLSVFACLSISIGSTLVVFLIAHAIRLFIGG